MKRISHNVEIFFYLYFTRDVQESARNTSTAPKKRRGNER